MPMETKDKISLGISLLSIAFSLTTFGIVQHRESEVQRDKDARLFLSIDALGEHIGTVRDLSREIYHAAEGSLYRQQLKGTRDQMLTVTQLEIGQLKLNAQLDKFPEDMNGAVNFVREEIGGTYGSRAQKVYDLGIGMGAVFHVIQTRLLPGTEREEDCIKVQSKFTPQMLTEKTSGADTCEFTFLRGFGSRVVVLNNQIKELGGRTEIAPYPKTVDEAAEALASAWGELRGSWER